jgi:ATP-binding cassette subfamily F protein uup
MRVIEFVKDIAEHFPLADGSSMSASQFLQLFLFSPEQQYTYISRLSGGEKRRLHLLSILFRNPNFLVLDEPTNDLDLPTLGVLENFLSEYQGCLLIVSHDRYFMDRLVDHLLVLEGDGYVRDFPGNYSQYREWVKLGNDEADFRPPGDGYKVPVPVEKAPAAKQVLPTPALEKRKLTYKEKRELEELEKDLARLTDEKKKITEQLNNGTTPFDELQKLSLRIGEISQALDEKEFRWLELSEIDK